MRYLFLFISLLLSSYTDSIAGNIEVCASCTVTSLRTAVESAMPHDTVSVQKGTYQEYNILVDKPLYIQGMDWPVIDGNDQGEIIKIVADSVTIDGLFIINVGTSYTSDWAAIRVTKSEHFVIRNVVLEKLFFGIYLEKSKNGIVYNNKIIGDATDEYNSGNGIQLWYSHNVVVSNNIVQKVRDGIYLEFSDDIEIKNNISTENLRYGLHFMFSNNDSYTDNRFENNGAGVAVMFSKHIEMKGNTFINNWGPSSFGLLLKEINDAEIHDNHFVENTVGISIEGSNRITYEGNEFKGNGWALKVRGACYGNHFTENNFLNNSFDLSYNSKVNDNTFSGNYWSGYTGYDLDRNGVGDVSYRPVKLFSYIIHRTPETIVLLRSLFMDIIDFSEKVSPVFTPNELVDEKPLMKPI